jgi:DNA-binding transcriptional MerR regulator
MMTKDDRNDEVRGVGPPAADRGVYGISVASELSGISEQSLRLYERQGLLTPARSQGGTRRYSADDLVRLQRISALVAAGVNLAGIERILSLEDRNTALDKLNVTLAGDNESLRAKSALRQEKKPSRKSRPEYGIGTV